MPDWVEDLLVWSMHMDHWVLLLDILVMAIGAILFKQCVWLISFKQDWWPEEPAPEPDYVGNEQFGIFWIILALKYTGLVKPCEIV